MAYITSTSSKWQLLAVYLPKLERSTKIVNVKMSSDFAIFADNL